MITKDNFSQDYVAKYFPKTDIKQFERDIFSNEKLVLNMILLNDEENKQVLNRYEKTNRYTAYAFLISLVPVFFFQRIPLLNRIEKRYKRIITKFFMIFLPFNITMGYQQNLNDQQLNNFYIKYFNQYQKYKFDGDIKNLSQNLKITDY